MLLVPSDLGTKTRPRKTILGYENVYLDLFEYFGLGHTRRHDYGRSRPEKYVNWTGYHKKLDRILLIHHCFAMTYILIACYVATCRREELVTLKYNKIHIKQRYNYLEACMNTF